MKRILAFLLLLVMCLSLFACDGTKDTPESDDEKEDNVNDKEEEKVIEELELLFS